MKLNEVTLDIVKNYIKVEHSDEDVLIQAMIDGAKSHIGAYTGLKDIDLDNKEDITIAVLILVAEMYDNRSATAKETKIREVLDRLLGSHSVNLL